MIKSSFFRVLLIFAIIEILLSFGLSYKINIGINPETGKLSFWHSEQTDNLQVKIKKQFQADDYIKTTGLTGTILGSSTLYNFFLKFTKTPISSFNLLKMLLIIDVLLFIFAMKVKKSLDRIPSKPQLISEMLYSFFETLTRETLGKKKIHFTAYIMTIFIFVLISNIIGSIPGLSEPTRNLNVPLGLGIMAISVVHFMAIKTKGLKTYLKGYAEPLFFLAPLNVIGELSKVISISFRLFGNIMGGAIIVVVVSSLVRYIMLPVGLNMFFGLFVGTIQAFVFTMLALTYIGSAIVE